MGGSESIEQARPTHGWRILHVFPNSPASDCNFVPFFDFVLVANDFRVDAIDSPLFPAGVANLKDQEMKLLVYNFKTQFVREVMITPREWEGTGYLGMVVAFDKHDSADEDCVHVEEVLRNSPAARAGLIPYADYLLCTYSHVFKSYDELTAVLHKHRGEPLPLYVYNAKSSSVRQVTVVPDSDGCLGCDVSTGFLHRIPIDEREVIFSKVQSSVGGDNVAPVEASGSGGGDAFKALEGEKASEDAQGAAIAQGSPPPQSGVSSGEAVSSAAPPAPNQVNPAVKSAGGHADSPALGDQQARSPEAGLSQSGRIPTSFAEAQRQQQQQPSAYFQGREHDHGGSGLAGSPPPQQPRGSARLLVNTDDSVLHADGQAPQPARGHVHEHGYGPGGMQHGRAHLLQSPSTAATHNGAHNGLLSGSAAGTGLSSVMTPVSSSASLHADGQRLYNANANSAAAAAAAATAGGTAGHAYGSTFSAAQSQGAPNGTGNNDPSASRSPLASPHKSPFAYPLPHGQLRSTALSGLGSSDTGASAEFQDVSLP